MRRVFAKSNRLQFRRRCYIIAKNGCGVDGVGVRVEVRGELDFAARNFYSADVGFVRQAVQNQ
jgi:hypothetical protein